MVKRKHPKPFKYDSARDPVGQPQPDRWQITAERGRIIALCYTEADARFTTISLNYFDRMRQALRLYRSEFDVATLPRRGPAYDDLVQLQTDIEADLRG